ncbi:MAG: hypothetical protein J7K68_02130 [Candidatus Diapherotrites archaeon]|nr:hypothetical protein [Candidatus Diapherotrites archaeon]
MSDELVEKVYKALMRAREEMAGDVFSISKPVPEWREVEEEWLPEHIAERIMREYNLHTGLSEDARTVIKNMLRRAKTKKRVEEIIRYVKDVRKI